MHIPRQAIQRLHDLAKQLEASHYTLQTLRFCTPDSQLFDQIVDLDASLLYTIGSLTLEMAQLQLPHLLGEHNISFNIDITDEEPIEAHVDFLFEIIRQQPQKCFNFTYVVNNPGASPYFPSSHYLCDGFSLGLQPTNLSADCQTIDEWLLAMKQCWHEILQLFSSEQDFIGIDSSIAPLWQDVGNLIHFLQRIGHPFSSSVLSPLFIQLTQFIQNENPKKAGLCGLMLPCLEDFDLAEQYNLGQFTIERNLFLSLHSGLGIDTYPIGVDEDKGVILSILKLLRALSHKHQKPLSARFISDGKAKIGEKTELNNRYLHDVVIRPLIE
ncbi:MAG: DUF711 family protein [Gammaproteobacteria bacterium]|nr:DUF711 family protein [Gammaproteobacteria bacterium]